MTEDRESWNTMQSEATALKYCECVKCTMYMYNVMCDTHVHCEDSSACLFCVIVAICRRRTEREKVSVRGVPEVWALSPERPEFE